MQTIFLCKAGIIISKNTTVWTKQHKNILRVLDEHGRYIAKKEYILNKMDTISPFYLDVYTWYTNKARTLVEKPEDVSYPVWVSLTNDTTLGNDEDTVVLELSVEERLVLKVDFEKWGYIVNYLYVPADEADMNAHEKLLKAYKVDDPTAYMSNFYPQIKSKIIKSWDRLFEDTALFKGSSFIGSLWEVKKEWIVRVIR